MMHWITPVHSPSYRPGARFPSTRLPWKLHPNRIDEAPEAATGEWAQTSATPASLPRVLIVEDESVVALDLMLTLRQVGCTVVGHALSGPEAIAEVQRTRPDLVLMDIRLQGEMDGIAAAGIIHTCCGTQIIFLTAFSDEDTLRRVKQVPNLAGFLLKPFSKQQLQAAITAALPRTAPL